MRTSYLEAPLNGSRFQQSHFTARAVSSLPPPQSVSLVADEAQLPAERDHALHDLLLHEVEAHGEHGHPEEDVHEAEDELAGRSSSIEMQA